MLLSIPMRQWMWLVVLLLLLLFMLVVKKEYNNHIFFLVFGCFFLIQEGLFRNVFR